VGLMARKALIELHRIMNDRRLAFRLPKVGVTFQANLLIRFLEKEPRIRFMGVVTGGAGAYGNRAVEELPLEFCGVVTTKAESILVFAHIQKIPAFPAMGIVA